MISPWKNEYSRLHCVFQSILNYCFDMNVNISIVTFKKTHETYTGFQVAWTKKGFIWGPNLKNKD